MDQQIILACDDNGRFLEYIPKEIGHTGEGKRHLAITVLLYNNKGQILLQRRKHKVFNDVWDMTASTHPLHTSSGDETLKEATSRALKDEYGIEKVDLRVLGSFNYFKKIGSLCENEHDFLLTGEYNNKIKLNLETAYEYKWVEKKEFLKDIEENPSNYTPWAIEGTRLLKQSGFF